MTEAPHRLTKLHVMMFPRDLRRLRRMSTKSGRPLAWYVRWGLERVFESFDENGERREG